MNREFQSQSLSVDTEEILKRNFNLGRRWAVIGIVGNLILTLFKYVAGFLGHSTAMVADATHSASDILASAAVFVSLKFSEKPQDKKHPYGHGGAEIISTVLCFLILLTAGLGIFLSGYEKIMGYLFRGENLQSPGLIAFVAAVVSIATKEWMYRATYKVGKEINSPSLIANALDHRSDVMSSIGTVVGIGGALLGLSVLDPISSMVVSLFILHMALGIGKEGVNQIMSASCDSTVLSSIRDTAATVPGVESVKCVRAKQQGPYIMADLTIEVDSQFSVAQGHDIAAAVKSSLLHYVNHISDVIVHVEPFFAVASNEVRS